MGMADETVKLPPRLRVPNADGLVMRRRESALAVGRQGYRVDAVGVSFQALQLRFELSQVPQPQDAIASAGQHGAAVGRETQAIDRSGVPLEEAELLRVVLVLGDHLAPGIVINPAVILLRGLRQVPEADALVGTRGNRIVPLARERDRVDRARVLGKLADLLPVVHVPEPHRLVGAARQDPLAVR